MTLGVNGVRLIGKRTGVGRAIEAILRGMEEVDHPFHKINVYTPEPLDESVTLPAGAENVVIRSSLPSGLWEQISLPLAHGSRGLLLCPSYVAPLLARCPVLLIHHGSYEGHPQAFSWWQLNKARLIYALSAWAATTVATVSEHSKHDIIRFYGISRNKIHVIPEGVDTRLFRPIEDARRLANWRMQVFGADVPFIVYVGKPTKRRNVPALIRALGRLKRDRDLPHKLLLIGTDLAGTSFEHIIAEMELEEEIYTLGFATHEEIAVAYNASDLLVYPSSYEGFGMPVLEAMACGTPAIALDNTAFPEFAEDVALLLPDAEVCTLCNGIEAVLTDPAQQAKMAEKGPKRAANYDWHVITKQYVDLMRQMVAT